TFETADDADEPAPPTGESEPFDGLVVVPVPAACRSAASRVGAARVRLALPRLARATRATPSPSPLPPLLGCDHPASRRRFVARAREFGRVRIERGPRGACIHRFLRERLRAIAPDVVVETDHTRPSLERRLASGERIGSLRLRMVDPLHAEAEIEAMLRANE